MKRTERRTSRRNTPNRGGAASQPASHRTRNDRYHLRSHTRHDTLQSRPTTSGFDDVPSEDEDPGLPHNQELKQRLEVLVIASSFTPQPRFPSDSILYLAKL